MKKIFVFILTIVIFIIGVNLGSDSFNQNELLEIEKEQFEESITKPNNDYEAKELVPKPNAVSKVANLFEETIEKAVEKAKEILKKL